MAENFSKTNNNNKHKSKKFRELQVRKTGKKIYWIKLQPKGQKPKEKKY